MVEVVALVAFHQETHAMHNTRISIKFIAKLLNKPGFNIQTDCTLICTIRIKVSLRHSTGSRRQGVVISDLIMNLLSRIRLQVKLEGHMPSITSLASNEELGNQRATINKFRGQMLTQCGGAEHIKQME